MKIKAKTNFISSALGNVEIGDDIPDTAYGRHLIEIGCAERVIEEERPKPKPEPKKTKTKTKKGSSK